MLVVDKEPPSLISTCYILSPFLSLSSSFLAAEPSNRLNTVTGAVLALKRAQKALSLGKMDAGPSTLAVSLDGGRNPLRNKRTRRATIGNEIDQIILHEMKSQGTCPLPAKASLPHGTHIVDNGPSIPLETKFIFTTNRDILPAHEQISGAFDLKNDSHKGYFDRPEVIDSYRKQLLIETPEFERIGPNQTVTSRFQPHMADANVSSRFV